MSLNLTRFARPDRGALFVVTGASGTGKTTLVKEALATIPNLRFSVSATTRAPRVGEVSGRDYHFVSQERYAEMVEAGAFLEWAEVYGNRYGTLREPVEAALARGESILLEIDAQGAAQVRAVLPDAVFIFILPPSIDTIEARLRGRSTDSEAIIQRRLADARLQLSRCGEFEYLLVNDDLNSGYDQLQAILIAELLRARRRASLVSQFTAG
jgi:guanylate kinase